MRTSLVVVCCLGFLLGCVKDQSLHTPSESSTEQLRQRQQDELFSTLAEFERTGYFTPERVDSLRQEGLDVIERLSDVVLDRPDKSDREAKIRQMIAEGVEAGHLTYDSPAEQERNVRMLVDYRTTEDQLSFWLRTAPRHAQQEMLRTLQERGIQVSRSSDGYTVHPPQRTSRAQFSKLNFIYGSHQGVDVAEYYFLTGGVFVLWDTYTGGNIAWLNVSPYADVSNDRVMLGHICYMNGDAEYCIVQRVYNKYGDLIDQDPFTRYDSGDSFLATCIHAYYSDPTFEETGYDCFAGCGPYGNCP